MTRERFEEFFGLFVFAFGPEKIANADLCQRCKLRLAEFVRDTLIHCLGFGFFAGGLELGAERHQTADEERMAGETLGELAQGAECRVLFIRLPLQVSFEKKRITRSSGAGIFLRHEIAVFDGLCSGDQFTRFDCGLVGLVSHHSNDRDASDGNDRSEHDFFDVLFKESLGAVDGIGMGLRDLACVVVDRLVVGHDE